jgi:hypothetical protein
MGIVGMSVIQQMHDLELGGGLAWPEDGKILVYLGCPLDPIRMREAGEALVGTFGEAEDWLRVKAKERFGVTFQASRKRGEAVVQRLYEARIPGSVYWIYDSAFAVTLKEHQGSVWNWTEAEAWLAKMWV